MGELPNHLRVAAERRSVKSRRAVEAVLQQIAAAPASYPRVTVPVVAELADVSVGWLYKQDGRPGSQNYRGAIEQLKASAPRGKGPVRPQRERASDASLLARVEALTELVAELRDENAKLSAALDVQLSDRWESA